MVKAKLSSENGEMPMTPCQRFKQVIFDLFDGELDILHRKSVERHLKECPRCTSFSNQIRVLRSHLKRLTRVRASEGFEVLLRERIRREIAGRGRSTVLSISFNGRLILATGFSLLLIVMGFWMLDQKTSFFNSLSPETEAVRYSLSREEDTESQVQYVIDDYPSYFSTSGTESERGSELAGKDSLLRQANMEAVRARVTPVSF